MRMFVYKYTNTYNICTRAHTYVYAKKKNVTMEIIIFVYLS